MQKGKLKDVFNFCKYASQSSNAMIWNEKQIAIIDKRREIRVDIYNNVYNFNFYFLIEVDSIDNLQVHSVKKRERGGEF